MEQKLKDINSKAEELSKKISKLQNENTLPLIELDIILQDIRTLYEEIKNLQTTSEKSDLANPSAQASPSESPGVKVTSREAPVAEAAIPEAPKAEEPPVEVPGEEVPQVEASAVEDHQAETISEVPKEETPPVEFSMEEAPQDEIPPFEVSQEETPEKSPEFTTLADRYKGEKRYINESLAGKIEKNDISSKIQSKPIQQISSALGLNDRFKLINDLFNGDKDSFQNTISVLDASTNFNEAFNYISSSFDWDMEEESVQILLELVRRKFIVNQNE